MSNLFGENNALLNIATRIGDALILNTIFLLCCLPIITIGPAYTAMYYYCIKAVGNEEGYLLKNFWKSFKTNFVQGIVLEIIAGAAAWILYIDIQYMSNKVSESGGSIGWKLLFFVVCGLALMVIITFMYAFPMLSKFDNKTFAILKNSLFMSIRHMGQTVPMIFILAIAVLLGYFMSPFSLLFVFGAWVYISSVFFHKIFAKYIVNNGVENPDDMYLDAEMPAPIEMGEGADIDSADNDETEKADS